MARPPYPAVEISKRFQTSLSHSQNVPFTLSSEVHSACSKILSIAPKRSKRLQPPPSTLIEASWKGQKIGFSCHQLDTSSRKEGSRRDLVQNRAELHIHITGFLPCRLFCRALCMAALCLVVVQECSQVTKGHMAT